MTAQAWRARLDIIGLGPGADEWITPQVRDVLSNATDLVGYAPYLARLPQKAGQQHHASDNREELSRARQALELAQLGRRVAVVSGGDPGIFAMAAAVFEALEYGPPEWRHIEIAVAPGISAMQAAAARVGAPLGHDFCAISLSDRLKPWPLIARRLAAAAEGDFVIALYNPASQTRRTQIDAAFALLRKHKAGETPVVVAQALGRPDERIVITTLAAADPTIIDMRTLVIIGSRATRLVARDGKPPFVYTPRSAVE
jgi:precorrin-3B C17-methyltransferase